MKSAHWSLATVLALLSLSGETRGAIAQPILPDATAGSTTFAPDSTTILIEGGTPSGNNLFHSFDRFSVPNRGFAYFINVDSPIENVVTRVTGSDASNILGTVGLLDSSSQLSPANFFFLNPNGIIFGPRARVLTGGSIVLTTGDRFRFEDGTSFSASQPQPPNLLTINAPIGIQFGAVASPIRNTSRAYGNFDYREGIRVDPAQTLAFVGGDILFDRGIASAYEGRLEMGSFAAGAEVAIAPDFSLSAIGIPTAGGEIVLRNESEVNGGNLHVRGQRIRLEGGSALLANVFGQELGSNIAVETPELILSGANADEDFASQISVSIFEDATGAAGDIQLNIGQLTLTDGAQITAQTYGNGTGGNIVVNADRIQALGESATGEFASGFLTRVEDDAAGRGGDLTLNAQQIEVRSGAEIRAGTRGAGNSGQVQVNTNELILSGGSPSDENYTGISTSGSTLATGRGGDLTVRADSVKILDGAALRTGNRGAGAGGNLWIQAREVELAGQDSYGTPSSIFANVDRPAATGQGGDLRLEVNQLSLADSASIFAGTYGIGNAGQLSIQADRIQIGSLDSANGTPGFISSGAEVGSRGNAGNTSIRANQLSMAHGSEVGTYTSGPGRGGDIKLEVADIEVVGDNTDGVTIITSASQGGTGAAGNLEIIGERLSVRDGGQILNATFGPGDAGNLMLRLSESVELMGLSAQFDLVSGLLSSTTLGSTGQGGMLSIETGRLRVADGAAIATSTEGSGNAGNLKIQAAEIELSTGRSPILSQITSANIAGTGQAGNIDITGQRLRVIDGGQISTSTENDRDAGTLTLRLSESVDLIGTGQTVPFDSELISRTGFNATGRGGLVSLETDQLRIASGGRVATSTLGAGDAGNVQIRARTVEVNDLVIGPIGDFSGIVATAEQGSRGKGGSVTIQADQIRLQRGGQISASSFGEGDAGNVNLQARQISAQGMAIAQYSIFPESILFPFERIVPPENPEVVPSQISSFSWLDGDAGRIAIATEILNLSDGGGLSTAALGNGNAGEITVRAQQISVLDGGIIASGTEGAGRGGNLSLTAAEIEVSGENAVATSLVESSSGAGAGQAGEIAVVSDRLRVTAGGKIASNTLGSGDAGDILIRSGLVEVSDGAIGLLGDPSGLGGANRSGIIATAEQGSSGKGGSIEIHADQVLVQRGGEISASSFGSGMAGSVTIKANDLTVRGTGVLAGGTESVASQISSASTQASDSGSLAIVTNRLSLQDGGTLSTSALGSGNAGTIQIQANQVRSNGGRITAIAAAGGGGNIDLAGQFLWLGNGSVLSTSVLDSTGGGGNIQLTASEMFLLTGGSVIEANAVSGPGGNIQINAPFFLTTPDTRVTASSAFGSDGQVNISTVADTKSLTPEQEVEIAGKEDEIVAGCRPESEGQNQFAMSGRGGLPMSPIQPHLNSLGLWQDQRESRTGQPASPRRLAEGPVEAIAFKISASGVPSLVAPASGRMEATAIACLRQKN